MKLLITGGCGFIGSNFIKQNLSLYPSDSIVNLDKLTYCGNPLNLKDIEGYPNYQFVKGDIADNTLVDDLMEGIDCVVHFAAESHVDRSIDNAFDFIHTNVQGTYNLLEKARKRRIKRFVHVSTDEVYGSIKSGSFTEESPIQPNSPYSATKAASDLLARSYFVTHKLPVVITRSSNNFGPYQFPEKVIPLFITNLIEGKKVPLYGDGSNIRDWIYVEDNCRAIDHVLRKGVDGEIYNIGGETEISNKKLTHKILSLMNKNDTSIEYVEDRLGHDFRYSLNCSKIHKELKLDYSPLFDENLKKTVEWYQNNEDWWKMLKRTQEV